jgi:superfamily II DNA or RNA helicase
VVKTEDEEESFGENTHKTKDHFYFSTFQTAFKKEIHSKLDYVDLIIIDEAHNVNNGSDFKQVLDELSQKTRNGKSPMILPVTATPSNLTKELF